MCLQYFKPVFIGMCKWRSMYSICTCIFIVIISFYYNNIIFNLNSDGYYKCNTRLLHYIYFSYDIFVGAICMHPNNEHLHLTLSINLKINSFYFISSV